MPRKPFPNIAPYLPLISLLVHAHFRFALRASDSAMYRQATSSTIEAVSIHSHTATQWNKGQSTGLLCPWHAKDCTAWYCIVKSAFLQKHQAGQKLKRLCIM